jgi:hypothetical protein
MKASQKPRFSQGLIFAPQQPPTWSVRILAIVALAIMSLGLVVYEFVTHSGIANIALRAASRLGLAHQGIEGNTTIRYWAINCPATTGDIGTSLNVTSANGRTVQYPLNWSFRPGCVHTSTFHIELHRGRYTVTLSTPMSCHKPQDGTFGGVTCDLAFDTIVAPGVYSPVYLYVTGGL